MRLIEAIPGTFSSKIICEVRRIFLFMTYSNLFDEEKQMTLLFGFQIRSLKSIVTEFLTEGSKNSLNGKTSFDVGFSDL